MEGKRSLNKNQSDLQMMHFNAKIVMVLVRLEEEPKSSRQFVFQEIPTKSEQVLGYLDVPPDMVSLNALLNGDFHIIFAERRKIILFQN